MSEAATETGRAASRPTDRVPVTAGLVATVLVHVALVVAFASVDASVPPVEGTIRRGQILCAGGLRCKAMGWHRPRLAIEAAPAADLGIIRASIIPRLGMAEQDPKKLPELQTYEQPEKVQDGVNISEENPPPDKPPLKAPEPKKERRDRRRPKRRSLDSILGAPEDDDPRVRPTHLSRIIGNPQGSVHGSGAEFQEGNEWAGKVQVKLRQEFHVPSSIDDRTLRTLKVEVVIKRISASGAIERFEVTSRSGNAAYNTAAVQLIKQFMPSEGGADSLPAPDPKTLEYVNRYGLLVELEGRLFRR